MRALVVVSSSLAGHQRIVVHTLSSAPKWSDADATSSNVALIAIVEPMKKDGSCQTDDATLYLTDLFRRPLEEAAMAEDHHNESFICTDATQTVLRCKGIRDYRIY